MANVGPMEENEKERPEGEHESDVRLSPMGSDGEKMMQSIEDGNMIAVLSKNEIMYTFLYRNEYQCFIHLPETQKFSFLLSFNQVISFNHKAHDQYC